MSVESRKLFRMKVRLYNNRLIRAREDLGLNQTEAARQIGITNSVLSAYENFGVRNGKRVLGQAWGPTGWTPSALMIADFYGYSPEYLWPEEIDSVRKNAMTLELSSADVHVFASGDMEARELASRVTEAKKLLSPAHREILEARFVDEKTLEELGDMRAARFGEEVGLSLIHI